MSGRGGTTLALLFVLGLFLNAALRGLTVGGTDNVVDANTAVFEDVSHDIVGSHVGHT